MNHEHLLKQCVNHPGRYFPTPEAVLQDLRFDRQEKKHILESWKDEEEQLLVATEENMEGKGSSRLQAVARALEQLNESRGGSR